MCYWPTPTLHLNYPTLRPHRRESDIQPSMVTHTQNLPIQVHTHSSEHTHTHTHTVSIVITHLLKGTSVGVLRVEKALYIHSPHLQSLPDRDSNSQPFDYDYKTY